MKFKKGNVMKSIIKNALLGGFMVAGMGLASLVSANPNSEYWAKHENGFYVVFGQGSAANVTAVLGTVDNQEYLAFSVAYPDCQQKRIEGRSQFTIPVAVNGRPMNAQVDCVEVKQEIEDALVLSFPNYADSPYVINQFKKSRKVIVKIGDDEHTFSAMGFSRALRDFRRANR
ncbi:hypothetical protein ACU6TU_09780 [Halomonas sp. LS-001]